MEGKERKSVKSSMILEPGNVQTAAMDTLMDGLHKHMKNGVKGLVENGQADSQHASDMRELRQQAEGFDNRPANELPVLLPMMVRSGQVNLVKTAWIMRSFLEADLTYSTAASVVFQFGTKQMIKFLFTVWTTQLWHFMDQYSIPGRLDILFYGFLSLNWNPVFMCAPNLIMFYPFGRADRFASYFALDVYAAPPLLSASLFPLLRKCQPVAYDHTSRRVFFGAHEDNYGERIGEQVFRLLRLPLAFYFTFKLVKLCSTYEEQKLTIRHRRLFYQKHFPGHPIDTLLEPLYNSVMEKTPFNASEFLDEVLGEAHSRISEILFE